MDFIATAPIDTPTTITNDGWFPAIELARVRASMRLDGTITPQRLADAVVAAIVSVNAELADWQAAQRAAGWQSLREVPAPTIHGESVLLAHYHRAVNHWTKADLTAHYRDFDSTHSGGQRAERLDTTIDEDRRIARWAIRDVLSLPHTTVELI